MTTPEQKNEATTGQSELSGLVSNFVDVFQYIKELMEHDCDFWRISEITDKPEGDIEETIGMFDHVYIYQRCGSADDDYYGAEYFPVGDGRYIKVEFSC